MTAPEDLVRERLSQALSELSRVQIELDQERRRRAEAEASFDELVWSMSDALLVVDQRGIVVRVNARATRLLGRLTDEVLGSRIETLLPSDVPATPWALLHQHPDGRFQVETSLDTADGTTPVSLTGAVIRDRAGKVTGGVYAARDLSETQRLVASLAEATDRWRLLGRTSDLVAGEIDPREALPEIAAEVSRATGATVAFALLDGVVVDRIVAAGDGSTAEALGRLRGRPVDATTAFGAVATGQPSTLHVPAVPSGYPLFGLEVETGDISDALLVALPGHDDVQGVVLLFTDGAGAVDEQRIELVEQIAARTGLAIANARLRDSLASLVADGQARQAREDLLAGVSHDMKTPLTILDGFVDQLAHDDGAGIPLDVLAPILKRQTHRLRRLVMQFLDYTCIEADRALSVGQVPVDLTAVLTDTVATIDDAQRVRLDLPPDLPLVVGDPQRLDQVFANLLTNALKFSPPGEMVTVDATVAGRTVRVAVTDRGPGVDPAEVDQMFEKFTRGAHAQRIEGTGLGLYVTNQLVRALAGHLHVEPRTGGGSRFIVSLPAVHGAAS
jgi:PAS domain S-box-containing protein